MFIDIFSSFVIGMCILALFGLAASIISLLIEFKPLAVIMVGLVVVCTLFGYLAKWTLGL